MVFGHRPHTTVLRIPRGQRLCVAVVFNPTGDFKPVSFGVLINSMRFRYTIKSVLSRKEDHGNIIFDCEYIDLGRIKTIRLVCDVALCIWTVG